jgi:hypothetical protein
VVQQKDGPVDGTPAPGGIKISHPSDRFELAAEQTAERVMSPRDQGVHATPSAGPAAQRMVDESALQRNGEELEEEEGGLASALQRNGEEEELTEENEGV